jgi:hypothetical protein
VPQKNQKETMMLRKLLAFVALGLILRIAYAATIYQPSLLPYILDDYVLYRMGAEAILSGDLTFTNDLFLMRPPLYPLLVAALDLHPLLIIATNIIFGTAVIPLSYVLARKLRLSYRLALVASLIVAVDPTSIKYSGVLVAEPLANLLLALAFISLAIAAKRQTGATSVLWAALAGAFITFSALTRPAAYLFSIPMGLWLAFARRQGRILATCALLVFGFGGAWLWMNHNAAAFGHRTFSTVGNFTMLYYRAASVLHQATGQEIDDVYAELARRVEARLGNDTADISAEKRHEHYTRTPQLQSAMTDVALGVFRDYPLYYLLTIPVGLYRMLIQVSGPLLLPGIAWNLALLLAAVFGLWRLIHAKDWATAMLLVFPCLYFIGGTLLVCTSCVDTRGRTMITPLLAIMAAYGIIHLLNRRRAVSASPSPPADS